MAHAKRGRPRDPAPVKYLAAILHPRGFDLESALLTALEERYGRVDYRGDPHPFAATDYYEDEMGPDLHRTIVSFEPLGAPDGLAPAKLASAGIEERFAEGGNRRVNVDLGYMDFFKVVLASFKEGPQKVYLGEGVYADPVLIFREGEWRPLEWSFPDFKVGAYRHDFQSIRALYREARRRAGHAP